MMPNSSPRLEGPQQWASAPADAFSCVCLALPDNQSPARGKEDVMGTRSWLYWHAKNLGDMNAVKRGRVGTRIARRATGKMTARGLGKPFG